MFILLYKLIVLLFAFGIRIASIWNPKAKIAFNGRKNIFKKIKTDLSQEKKQTIWIHCASLGEFEQGRPLMELIKKENPEEKIVLTFFSPSGYEIKKNYPHADYIFYLPLDTKRNAQKFISLINPKLAIFVKYEFWFHYLNTINEKNIPLILISSFFQSNQIFFKLYGGFYRKMLSFFNQIFVQDLESKNLLQNININQVQIAGDTRFDRCNQIRNHSRTFKNLETFKGEKKLIIAGSTWEEDEVLLQKTINIIGTGYKLLIVPHEIDQENINRIKTLFENRICIWNDEDVLLKNYNVCILNEIGFLSYIYKYADIVWVGGGFTKSGIHNIIEPAVFGIPIFFGPNYKRFREAYEMISNHAAVSLKNENELSNAILNISSLKEMGASSQKYVYSQLGATQKIFHYLKNKQILSSI